jgi:endoglucanase
MKNKSPFLIFVLFFLTFSFNANSQNFLKTQGKIIVDSSGDTVLLRAMGLGGWMLQEGYMMQTAGFAGTQYQIRNLIEQLIGTTDTDAFYDAWLANHCRKVDIDSLAAWGFNAVRLPMHYKLYTLPIEDEPIAGQQTWLTKGFVLTDSLISWCKQNNMYVILDLHAAPGGQGYNADISDYDPTKPSLFESQANQDKMVALWKKLAQRYVNEDAVAAYDILNEPNWNLPGGTLLRQIYERVTDTIRAIDNNHMLLIEGNWFANDFTGLTPPWDNNMVYSPHKYWSFNEPTDLDWILPLRDTYNVPIYFGESGENSNAWFRDAIKLFENNHIGWAWWPMKKIESISCPASVTKNTGYQALLDYWSGNGSQPTAAAAKSALMQLANDLKLENCRYQKDVIDAMFRQVQSNDTKPYRNHTIPGVVFGSDFDMGRVDFAYYDKESADYHVSTNNYTAWNNGWVYRNDGVDLEPCSDNVNTTGYNVGWIETDEWLQYTVDVAADAVYDVNIRMASGVGSGRFHLIMDGVDLSTPQYVPNTSGWQTWQTVTVPNVILSQNDKKLRFYADAQGFNMSSLQFIQKGSTTSIPTEFVSGTTVDANTVQIHFNKPLQSPLPTMPAGFQIFVNGTSVPILSMNIDANSNRIIHFNIDANLEFNDIIKGSYTGAQVNATDGTTLSTFILKDIKNNLPLIHAIPGRIEAEDYFNQFGTQKEFTSDFDGVYNLGYMDVNDYMDYNVEVASATNYTVSYRTSADGSTGGVALQLVDNTGNATVLQNISFPPTGSWNAWATTSANATLPAGRHHFRVLVTQAPFNFNWMDFSFVTSDRNLPAFQQVQIYPNPNYGQFYVSASLEKAQNVHIQVFNLLGQVILNKEINTVSSIQETLDLSAFPDGHYLIKIQAENGAVFTDKLVKID